MHLHIGAIRPHDRNSCSSDNFICTILGISNKVNKSYLSVTNRFQSLALSNNWLNPDGSVWPISLDHLLAYIAIIHKSINPSTLLSYLSALNDKHASMGFNWNPVRYNPSTLRTLNLIKRAYVHRPTKKAEIITRSHLFTISSYKFPDEFETLLFRAIAFIAFYGLARLGELVQSSSNPTNNTLYIDNIAIHSDANPPCVLIQLPIAKTRNSAFPDILVIHQTFDELCPTRIISTYIKARLSLNLNADQRYLFSHKDGSLANKRWFLQKLNEIFPQKRLSGHGFRAGGTTELILRGLPPHIVQLAGRWSSDTFEEYIRRHPLVLNAHITALYRNTNPGNIA